MINEYVNQYILISKTRRPFISIIIQGPCILSKKLLFELRERSMVPWIDGRKALPTEEGMHFSQVEPFKTFLYPMRWHWGNEEQDGQNLDNSCMKNVSVSKVGFWVVMIRNTLGLKCTAATDLHITCLDLYITWTGFYKST